MRAAQFTVCHLRAMTTSVRTPALLRYLNPSFAEILTVPETSSHMRNHALGWHDEAALRPVRQRPSTLRGSN
jgi:hypothetical protein